MEYILSAELRGSTVSQSMGNHQCDDISDTEQRPYNWLKAIIIQSMTT